jgi:hypothetical protein
VSVAYTTPLVFPAKAAALAASPAPAGLERALGYAAPAVLAASGSTTLAHFFLSARSAFAVGKQLKVVVFAAAASVIPFFIYGASMYGILLRRLIHDTHVKLENQQFVTAICVITESLNYGMGFLDCSDITSTPHELELKILDNLKTVRPVLIFIYARLQGIAAVASLIHFVLLTLLPITTLILDIKLNYHFLIFHMPHLLFREYQGDLWLPQASALMLFSGI